MDIFSQILNNKNNLINLTEPPSVEKVAAYNFDSKVTSVILPTLGNPATFFCTWSFFSDENYTVTGQIQMSNDGGNSFFTTGVYDERYLLIGSTYDTGSSTGATGIRFTGPPAQNTAGMGFFYLIKTKNNPTENYLLGMTSYRSSNRTMIISGRSQNNYNAIRFNFTASSGFTGVTGSVSLYRFI